MTTNTNTFARLGLGPEWLENLDRLGYVEMTPIQARALPRMLEGGDVIGQAATGTGKTAAFGLALLARVERAGRPGRGPVTGLVLCPTRELAAQIADELRRLARPLPNTSVITLTGGTSLDRQREALERGGVDVVVGTPGRVLDHLRRGTLDLSAVATLVLDEADRMLDMGFVDDVTAIAEATPASRQTLLFSATTSDDVRALSGELLREPETVVVTGEEATPDITQILYDIDDTDRADALRAVLAYHRPESAVIFCNERDTADAVAVALSGAGYSVNSIHGGMEQRDRDNVLLMFENGSLRLLVATNVAARGLDIEELGAVINYELPRDPGEFVHRVGRTGRAGERGLAISLVAPGERRKLAAIGAPVEGVELRPLATLEGADEDPQPAPMKTVVIQGGRKNKLRPGDIVGALTGELGIDNDAIGRIRVGARVAHVALARSIADDAFARLARGRIKGRTFKVHMLE